MSDDRSEQAEVTRPWRKLSKEAVCDISVSVAGVLGVTFVEEDGTTEVAARQHIFLQEEDWNFSTRCASFLRRPWLVAGPWRCRTRMSKVLRCFARNFSQSQCRLGSCNQPSALGGHCAQA